MVKVGLDVAQIWLDGDETLVNTIDRDGNMLPINMIDGHAITHDPLVVLVSSGPFSSVLSLFLFQLQVIKVALHFFFFNKLHG